MAANFIGKSAKMTIAMSVTDPDTGKLVSKSITVNGLATNAQATPVSNVVDLIAPCLENPVSGTTYTVVSTVEKE